MFSNTNFTIGVVDGVGMNGGGPLRGGEGANTHSERRDAFSTPKPYSNPR